MAKHHSQRSALNARSFPRLVQAGDAAVTVEFGDRIAPAINGRVRRFAEAVAAKRWPGILEVVPTFRSATVYYDPLVVPAATLARRLRVLASWPSRPAPAARRRVEVPVCYDEEFGPDLAALAAAAGLTPTEAAALHRSVEYRVYMLGFTPGFPYLGPVPAALAAPRLAEPRLRVPAGSVGIAGEQTGIYPLESPGGWRLIGRTPLRLYEPARTPPFLLAPGDVVRFVPIDRRTYEELMMGRRRE